MNKEYECPEMEIISFEIQEPIMDDLGGSVVKPDF